MNPKHFFRSLRFRVVELFKFVFRLLAYPKPKEFTNNPKLLKELKKQRKRKKPNKNKQNEKPGSSNSQGSGRVTEEQVHGLYSSTNWGS